MESGVGSEKLDSFTTTLDNEGVRAPDDDFNPRAGRARVSILPIAMLFLGRCLLGLEVAARVCGEIHDGRPDGMLLVKNIAR